MTCTLLSWDALIAVDCLVARNVQAGVALQEAPCVFKSVLGVLSVVLGLGCMELRKVARLVCEITVAIVMILFDVVVVCFLVPSGMRGCENAWR